jgi:ketosteroid isomerase-like protein
VGDVAGDVELTLRIIDAFNRRHVEAVTALWDDEGVWYPAIEASTEARKTYRGHAGMRQYYGDLAEFAEGSHVELSEVYDLGDRVLGLGRLSVKFVSGVELDQEGAGLHLAERKVPRSAGLDEPCRSPRSRRAARVGRPRFCTAQLGRSISYCAVQNDSRRDVRVATERGSGTPPTGKAPGPEAPALLSDGQSLNDYLVRDHYRHCPGGPSHTVSVLLPRLPCPVLVVCVVCALLFGLAFGLDTFSSGSTQIESEPDFV